MTISNIIYVLSCSTVGEFPPRGNINTLYIDEASNLLYRWTGTQYILFTQFQSVATYADLPAAADHNGEVWLVTTSTGIWPFNHPAGFYTSNGVTWTEIPATAGAITYADLFAISPITYDGAGTFSTSMTTNKLIGRYSASAGVMQEITIGSGLSLDGSGNLTSSGTGGTVTSVSVVTANGVSGSVSNATTTPAITLTLGDITPSSVSAVGTGAFGILNVTNNFSALANTNKALSFNSVLSDGNYINLGGSGRNIGVTSAGAAFSSFGVDWDANNNSYVYTNSLQAINSIEQTFAGIFLKYGPSGTAGNLVTLTTGLILEPSGLVTITGNLTVSGSISGTVTNATNATNINITDTSTGGTYYLTFSSTFGSPQTLYTASTNLIFNPNATGVASLLMTNTVGSTLTLSASNVSGSTAAQLNLSRGLVTNSSSLVMFQTAFSETWSAGMIAGDSLFSIYDNLNSFRQVSIAQANAGSFIIHKTTAATAVGTGSLYTLGGASFNGAIWASGALNITSTTASSSTTTGSGIFAGGVGIAGKLYIGGDLDVVSKINVSSYSSGSTTGFLNFATNTLGASYITVGNAGRAIGIEASTGDFIFNRNISYDGTYKYLNTGGGSQIVLTTTGGNLKYTPSGTAGTTATLSTALSWNLSGVVNIPATTASTSTITGALTVGGGVGISGNLYASTLNATGTGSVFINATSTTTGSANEGSLKLTRGDSANGLAQVRYYTGATESWSEGLRAGDSKYYIRDVVNSVNAFTLTAGAGITGSASFIGQLSCGDLLSCVSLQSTVGNGIQAGIFTANSANATGLLIYPFTASGTADGVRMYMKKNNTLANGFSIGYNGSVANTILNWAATSFNISRHNGSGTGTVCISIAESGGITISEATTFSSTLTATLTGNASTATTLQTARNIGGVSFNGSANIVPQTIESAIEATDTTCFPLFITASGTQQLQPKNNASFTFDSSTATLGVSALNIGGTASYPCRAWVNYNGTGTPAIRDSDNVSSITDNGTGKFGVNLTNAMPDANYAALGFCRNEVVGGDLACNIEQGTTPAAGSFRMAMSRSGTGFVDSTYIYAAVFR